MSPVGSNMRAGSTVLSTNEVSTTRLAAAGAEVWPPLVPLLLLLLLLLQAPRPTVTATTQPAASHWLNRMGLPPLSWRGDRTAAGREMNRQTFPPIQSAG